MKLLERTKHQHDADVTEVLERIEVPDDLSGLEHAPPPMIEAPHRAATRVRWLRWAPLFLLVIAGAVVAAIVIAGDERSVEAPWAANEGPGSHSLDTPQLVQSGAPWAANEGPGSSSLRMAPLFEDRVVAPAPAAVPVDPMTTWIETQGPGSSSLGTTPAPPIPQVTAADVAAWFTTQGPGSSSLNTDSTPPIADAVAPWTWESGGPGSHSLELNS